MTTLNRHGRPSLLLAAALWLCLFAPAHAEKASEIPILTELVTSMEQVASDIKKTQASLSGPDGVGNEENLKKQMEELNQKQARIEKGFQQLAAGVEFRPEPKPQDQEFKWEREIKELLGPLIREIKRATATPRKIEALRSEIEQYDTDLALSKTAIANLNRVMASTQADTPLTLKLAALKSQWESRQVETQALRNAAGFKLEKLTVKKQSLGASLQDFMRFFFKSRGRNLLTAMAVVAALSFLLLKGHGLIQRTGPLRNGERSIYVRLFNLLYFIFSALLILGATLAVFYLYNDWVLLSLIIVFILAICWASRLTLPMYWGQARLILNLGPVREGELITYNDLPFRINKINFTTELENPRLQGGRIRIPLKDISEFRSRPTVENEPWFPTHTGDWVLLDDGTHGQIQVQTSETVQIRLIGESVKSYLTPRFLAAAPMNLSSGFRLWIPFHMGHTVLEAVPQGLIPTLEESIRNGLINQGHGTPLTALSARFKHTSGSSLQLEITADFKGEAAPDYLELDRLIRTLCLSACHANQWPPPRHQLELHTGENTPPQGF